MKATVVTTLVLVLVAAAVLTATASAAQVLYRFDTGTHDGNEYHPDISDGIIVWDQKDASGWNIWGYDMSSHSRFAICVAAGDQVTPAISDKYVVWEDRRNGNADIYGYDLDTDTSFVVCNDPANQTHPRIEDEWVVWQDDRNGNPDIYGRVLPAGAEAPICVDSAPQSEPDVYGDTVVWVDRRYGDKDILGYNRVADFTFTICTARSEQDQPAIDHDTVVWRDNRNKSSAGSDIIGRDLTTGREFTVCGATGNQREPALGDDIVVWSDARDAGRGFDIWARDLAFDQELAIVKSSGWQGQPAIDGFDVVWADAANSRVASIRGAGLTPWTAKVVANGGHVWTRSTRVSLRLSAQSRTGIVTQMAIRNGAGPLDWAWFSSSRDPWYLTPGDGVKTVNVSYKDLSGEVSPTVSATIKLDSTGPVTSVPKRTSTPTNRRVRIGYRVTDNLSPKADVTIRITNHAGAVARTILVGWVKTGSLHEGSFFCRLRSGDYLVKVFAKDLAGNKQSKAGYNKLVVK